MNGRLSTPDGFETGVHWIAFPADLSYGLRHRREERFGPREQLRPYRRAHVFDVWSLDDPAPAVRTITMRLRRSPPRGGDARASAVAPPSALEADRLRRRHGRG